MKKIFFMTLVIIFGFIACQKEENALPMVEKGKKSMSAENEALYNSIVDFRHKLLTQDYTAGESIATSDAILLMEASLNLTYRHSDEVRHNTKGFHSSIVADKTFANATVEYATLYTTYQDILADIRLTNKDITESIKKLKVVDLELDGNNNILINTNFEVNVTLPLDVPHGRFVTENLKTETFLNNRFPPAYYTYVYGVEFDNSISKSVLTQQEYYSLQSNNIADNEYYFVKDYFVNTYGYCSGNLNYVILGSTDGFGSDYYSVLEGTYNMLNFAHETEIARRMSLISCVLDMAQVPTLSVNYFYFHQTMKNKHYVDVVWVVDVPIIPENINDSYNCID